MTSEDHHRPILKREKGKTEIKEKDEIERRNIKLFSYRETTSFKGLGVDFSQGEWRMAVSIENELY